MGTYSDSAADSLRDRTLNSIHVGKSLKGKDKATEDSNNANNAEHQPSRPSGVPTPVARRTGSHACLKSGTTNESASASPGRWRLGSCTALAPLPSVSISAVHAEPVQEVSLSSSATGSGTVSARLKRASENVFSTRSLGNGGRASASDMEADGNGDSIRPRIPAPEPSTESHLSVKSETSLSTCKTRTRQRADSSTSSSSTIAIMRHLNLATPVAPTASTSMAVIELPAKASVPGAAASVLQVQAVQAAGSNVPTSRTSAGSEPSYSLTAASASESTHGASSWTNPMPPSGQQFGGDLILPRSQSPTALTEEEIKEVPLLQVQPPTPAIMQGGRGAELGSDGVMLPIEPSLISTPPSVAVSSERSQPSTSTPPPEHVSDILSQSPPLLSPASSSSFAPGPGSLHSLTSSLLGTHKPKARSVSGATPSSSVSPSRVSSPVQQISAPKPKRSWFGSRPVTPEARASSVPVSPVKRAFGTASSSTTVGGSVLAFVRSGTPSPEERDATTNGEGQEDIPRPATPPPLYPLELRLEVDNAVDSRAMRIHPDSQEGDEEVDEPPVYSAAERERDRIRRSEGIGQGAGMDAKKAFKSPTKTQVVDKQSGSQLSGSRSASNPSAEMNAVDNGVSSRPDTPTEDKREKPNESQSQSPSRFVLSFPLLGRTKLPLGVVLGGGGALGAAGGGGMVEIVRKEQERLKEFLPSTSPTSDVVPFLHEEGKASASEAGPSVNTDSGTGSPTGNALVKTASESDTGEGARPISSPEREPEGIPGGRDEKAAATIPVPPSPAEGGVQAQTQPDSASNVQTNDGGAGMGKGEGAGGSWWNYVDWAAGRRGSSAPQSSSSAPVSKSINRISAQQQTGISTGTQDPVICCDEQSGAAEEGARTAEGDMLDAKVETGCEAGANVEVEVNVEPMPEKEEGEKTQVTVWYSPWGWYARSPAARAPSSEGTGSELEAHDTPHKDPDRNQDASLLVQGDESIPSELLSTSPHNTVPMSSSPPTSPLVAPLTPGQLLAPERTIASSLSGWAAYFTSRARVNVLVGAAKSIEGTDRVERDEDGCEVMHLDSDEEDASGDKEEAARGRTSGGTGSRLIRDQRNSSSRGRSPAPSTGSGGQTRALTMSTTTKSSMPNSSPTSAAGPGITNTGKTGAGSTPGTRTTSPAPAYPKKPPAPPAPPNLVLPTWADTFFVPPRSVLPPRTPSPSPSPSPPASPKESEGGGGPGMLGKTLKFVGNVLFAGAGALAPVMAAAPLPSESAGKGKAKAKGKDARTRAGSATSSQIASGKKTRIPRPRAARVASASSGVSVRIDGDSSDGSDNEGEGDGKEVIDQQWRAALRSWGQELPKAWRVLEEGRARDWEPDAYRGSRPVRTSSIVTPRMQRQGSWLASKVTLDENGRSRAGKGDGPERTEVVDAGEESRGMGDPLQGAKRVVVIGIHGWFPGAMIRTVLGEPTGTSTKFASMTEQALHLFESEHGVAFDKITQIPLEGDGTIERRVDKHYATLLASPEWLADLHAADAVIVSTHSQGSIVSTHLIDRLIKDGHINTRRNSSVHSGNNQESNAETLTDLAIRVGEGGVGGAIGIGGSPERARKVQRVCLLALCGIHLGPLRYLSSSTLVGPYLQYFESIAARELFEFQNTESAVSKAYIAALENVVDHGTKVLYVASLNDQVVPIYSGVFAAVSHPTILRALYIDGDAYHSSDFLSNLLILLLRIRNAGISDSGLLAHLSEATAGSLNGVGHSTAYEEIATYSLAVKYLFLVNDGQKEGCKLIVDNFNALQERNDYEIPWALRDIIADARVAHFFAHDIAALRDAFKEWHPKTTILRDLKRKLQPITRLPVGFERGLTVTGLGTSVGMWRGSKL